MATPNFDMMHMMFRRHPQVSDLYSPTLGTAITSASTDGNWTVAEVSEMLVRGINRLLAQSYATVAAKVGILDEIGDTLYSLFPEYVLPANLTSVVAGRVQKELVGTLPSDFLAPISASHYFTGQGVPQRIRFVSPRYMESALMDLYPELTSLIASLRDGKMSVMAPNLSPAVSLAGTTDRVEVTYLRSQSSLTQGGATDVKLREAWWQDAVNLAVSLIPAQG